MHRGWGGRVGFLWFLVGMERRGFGSLHILRRDGEGRRIWSLGSLAHLLVRRNHRK